MAAWWRSGRDDSRRDDKHKSPIIRSRRSPDSSMSDFAKAIEMVIATHEGGFQKRVDDPGNWTPAGELRGTKFGISAHSFPDVDIEALTLNEAEELYRKVWGIFASLEDQRVLTKVLDLAVNMQWAGNGPATRILQRAVAACGGQLEIDE